MNVPENLKSNLPHLTLANAKIPIAISILIIFIYLLFFPLFKQVLDNQKSINSKNNELEQLIGKELDLKKLESDYKENIDALSKLKEALPKDRETTDFINQLEFVAKQNNLTITNFKFPEEKKSSAKATTENNDKKEQTSTKNTPAAATTEKSNEITFDLELLGDFNKAHAFIAKMESLTRYSEISNIDIQAQDNLVVLSIKGKIFKQ